MNRELKFRGDGTFTIVQFTDMHLGGGKEDELDRDAQTLELVRRVVELEQPDFIVLTGDMIWSHGVADPQASFRKAISTVVECGVPWAAVFGNHDTEEGVTKEELLRIQHEYVSCLTQAGPSDISGVGNYVLTVKSASKSGSSEAALLYFLDSGMMAPEEVGGYEWIHRDQIHWYAEQSRKAEDRNGKKLPALGFFHIPLQEYDELWKVGNVSGSKFERVECAKVNSGLFTALMERGDVIGTFVGHDHDNDYTGMLHGIRLCYGRVSGYNCYGKLQRGARVIRLQEGLRDFKTWIRLDDGGIAR
ncbi:metallophosphoesterase family protein [Paenibacillus sp. LHD-38]|uniref:metallophosphoesterase family protein n=1 Tax=Paenibacillus sp. LHD-38 TaxID=3072143 RepID=UPI00280D31B6|nr:metallophosphoesterase family protein [Paenibacillus sp. LHD-38]MDQ8734719.1 metallophosphoesterase family protein [Paenibacillus sp. LHD-38]